MSKIVKTKVEFVDFQTNKNVDLDEVPDLHSLVELGSLGNFFVRDIKFIYHEQKCYQFLIHTDSQDSEFLYHLKEIIVFLEPRP